MNQAAYVSFDDPNPNTGSGQVVIHETNALRRIFRDLIVITRKGIKGADQYEFSPWLYDYFCAQLLPKDLDFLDMHCSPGLAILAAARPKKYVVSIIAHDLALSIEEHERYYGKGSYPFKHNTDPYLHSLLLKHAETADAILTPSIGSEKWIRANINNPRVVVMPHGLTKVPESVQPFPDKLRFGYLGAFGPDKGLLYLLMAWPHFTGGELVFGGGSCQYIKQLARQIDPTLRDQTYLGWVGEVSDFYNQVSVYIQPSVTEGFGIEIIEAMAHGRPVIATTGTSGPDVITDGVEGFIVPPRDPKAILEKMMFFRDNPGKIADMGLKAKERAREYSWEKIEQRYYDFYLGLLESHGNNRAH